MMFPANIWIKISARDRAAYRRASLMKHGFAPDTSAKAKMLAASWSARAPSDVRLNGFLTSDAFGGRSFRVLGEAVTTIRDDDLLSLAVSARREATWVIRSRSGNLCNAA